MDGLDELSESTGGGNRTDRADLQLTLFPTEDEQIARIDAAESPEPFAVSFSDEEINTFLRYGSNTDQARLLITAEFMKVRPAEERESFLRTVFRGGYGVNTEHGKVAAWYAEDGIHINRGDTARYSKNALIVPWTEAAERITDMLEKGVFATNVELEEAPGAERLKMAESLWYLYHDMSDDARDVGYLGRLETPFEGGFPDAAARLAGLIDDPVFRNDLIPQVNAFLIAYGDDDSLLRFHYHRPDQILQKLLDLNLHRVRYHGDLAELPPVYPFITEDEINEAITGGSGMEGGKDRIYRYFTETHTSREKADFLKNEYGIGGRSHALSHASGSGESHEARGERFMKNGCAPVEMKWLEVAKLQRCERVYDLRHGTCKCVQNP